MYHGRCANGELPDFCGRTKRPVVIWERDKPQKEKGRDSHAFLKCFCYWLKGTEHFVLVR